MLRTVVQGRRRDIGLGGAQLVSLADAREKAFTLRKVARGGGDPVAEKARTLVPTFAQAAHSAHTEHVAAWRNKKHAAQWISTLRKYAFPSIGARRVDQIETPDVLKVLSPIWLSKPETARRVKQRIGTVLDWAKAAGFRTGENAVNGVAKGLPKQPDRRNTTRRSPTEKCDPSSWGSAPVTPASRPNWPSSSSSDGRPHKRSAPSAVERSEG